MRFITKTSSTTLPLSSLLLFLFVSLIFADENLEDGSGNFDISDNNEDITKEMTCDDYNDDCDQNCEMIENEPKCSCNKGFYLDEDGKTCIDINECETENKCQHKCENTIGSYQCIDDMAPMNISTAADECKILHGCSHGCTQDECTCPDGFDLDDDEKTCVDIDECAEGEDIYENSEEDEEEEEGDDDMYDEDYPENNHRKKRHSKKSNGLCSHKCVNTPGSFYCTCPSNFYLGRDLRSCIEDEEIPELNCSHFAVKIGDKFNCSCPNNNMTLGDDGRTCESIVSICDKNCSHRCVRENDKYVCVCEEGSHLLKDGLTCAENCKIGYRMSSEDECVDVDECLKNNGDCNQKCINNDGSYTCKCNEGYKLDIDNKNCIDIDECLIEDSCSHECKNLPGTFECSCPEGYELDATGKKCDSVDACSSIDCSHGCDPEKFVCICPEGFVLKNDTQCIIDPCATDKNECSHECVHSDGIVSCVCPKGMYLDSDNVTCLTLKKCQINNGGCSHECKEDDAGNVQCSCPSYLVLINNTECVSTDKECSLLKAKCSHICKISNGTVRCECPTSYILGRDGFTCEPDLCFGDNGGCSHSCNSIDDRVICSCPPNYRLKPTDRFSCVQIDSCSLDNGKCSQICKDVDGETVCDCFEGYALDENGFDCIKQELNPCDINNGNCSDICITIDGIVKCECSIGKVMLSEGSCVDRCSVNNGGCYQKCNGGSEKLCSCYEGFVLNEDGVSCDDVDECETDQNDCQQTCLNSDGDYECGCFLGYKLADDGKTCVDIDECQRENNPCTHRCINTAGSYNCICSENMRLTEDNQCVNVDACSVNNGDCSQICETGDEGDAACSCFQGFVLNEDGRKCDDVDECITGVSNCTDVCLNYDGGYDCACPNGKILSQDGHTCIRYDRCKLENGGCSHVCIDNSSGIFCGCPPGYFLDRDERTCVDIDECMLNVCESECVNLPGSYRCSCQNGYKLSADNRTCEDIDECDERCEQSCTNTAGSFRCDCFEGYRLNSDGLTCSDVDECLENVCSDECFNTVGSYKCLCPTGHELSKDNSSCVDVDECKLGLHKCSHHCINTPGGHICDCRKGYKLDGDDRTCVDIDECTIMDNGGCSQLCHNLPGGFGCACYEGFELSTDGFVCVPKNPCTINNGGCSQLCTVAHDGKATCGCNEGFKTDPKNQNICIDIDECSEGSKCHHKCINLYGSYRCSCNEGFVDNNGICEDINECDAVEFPCDREMKCINTPGNYKCECKDGYGLQVNGTRSICVENIKACQPIIAPMHGSMKCFHDKNKNSMYKSGTRCHFWCEKGHRLKGSVIRKCNSNGHWDGIETRCMPNSCPRLMKPNNGYFVPSKCSNGDNYPSEFCTLVCNPGFKPKSARMLTCTANSKWSPQNLPVICVPNKPLFKTFIKCPPDVKVQLGSSEKETNVVIPKPVSNMDWWRYIDSDPAWAKNGQQRLGPGVYPIIYKARSAYNDSVESCQFTITVLDIEKPTVVYCPSSIDIRLNQDEYFRRVFWDEPKFDDNIGINEIHRSKVPGSPIGIGIHHVDYIATDHSGNKAYCHFTLNVIDPNRDIEEFHLRQGILMCPGQHPRRTHPGELSQIPKDCTLRWLRSKIRNKPQNYQNSAKFRHYDGWNTHILRRKMRTRENYMNNK